MIPRAAEEDARSTKNDLRDDAVSFSAFRADETAPFDFVLHGANASVDERQMSRDSAWIFILIQSDFIIKRGLCDKQSSRYYCNYDDISSKVINVTCNK